MKNEALVESILGLLHGNLKEGNITETIKETYSSLFSVNLQFLTSLYIMGVSEEALKLLPTELDTGITNVINRINSVTKSLEEDRPHGTSTH